MAAEIKAARGIASELIRGDGGVFDVVVDGRIVFSKHDSGRYPELDEILEALDTPDAR